MPSSLGHHNTQRRIFRGKGGATDGRLPPKKNSRVKVKYQAENSHESEAQVNDNAYAQDELMVAESDHGIHCDEQKQSIEEDPALVELKHLQKRVHNIQISLQTSSGMSNLQIWYTNCLLPVKNVLKEWRSICKFHFPKHTASQREDIRESGIHVYIVKESSVEVFNLLQMAMQSGPLVGSNPGYFKRCGSAVASMALLFLNEIVDLAGVNETIVEGARHITEVADVSNSDENEQIADDRHHKLSNHDMKAEVDKLVIASSSSSSCDSSSESHDSNGEEAETGNQATPPQNIDNFYSTRLHIIQSLQSSLLLSVKQSQRICEWMQNAQKAVQANKAPSKSSKKLQSQKSKKQQIKDLKMERNLKKKKQKKVGDK